LILTICRMSAGYARIGFTAKMIHKASEWTVVSMKDDWDTVFPQPAS
jgi:hypothetical protein